MGLLIPPIAALVGLVILGTGAQSATARLIGRVIDERGAPVPNAVVRALDGRDIELGRADTDAGGNYVVRVSTNGSAALVRASRDGFVARTIRVAFPNADSVVRVPDIQLIRTTVLPEVRTVAARKRVARDASGFGRSPGEQTIVLGANATTLTGDLTGDPEVALGAVPGISLVSNGDGVPKYSLAGLGPEQNLVTLNGTPGPVVSLRDGGMLRITTSSYDPAKSASGVTSDWVMLSGNNLKTRLVHVTLDAPALQWPNDVARGLGKTTTYPLVSGVIAGRIPGRASFYSTSYQIGRRSVPAYTLESARPISLLALRIDPDTVAALLGALPATGLPLTDTRSSDRVSTSASVFTRLDLNANGIATGSERPDGGAAYSFGDRGDGRVTYVIFGGSWQEQNGRGENIAARSLYGSESSSESGTLQALNSFFFSDAKVLSESRTAITIGRNREDPRSALPSATVLVPLRAPSAGTELTAVQLSGSGAAPTRGRRLNWIGSEELRWASRNARHEFKLAFEARAEREEYDRGESAGGYLFNDIASFTTGRPALFARATTAANASVRGTHAALAAGDAYTPNKVFSAQYGLRVETHSFTSSATSNAAVDSIFGARTNAVPRFTTIAPMAGFTWYYGPKSTLGLPDYKHTVSGGIRDYRGVLRAGELLDVFSGIGATRELTCVGSAVPAPDWSAFSDPNLIPRECTDASLPSATVGSAIDAVSQHASVGHSWRAELTWSLPVTSNLSGSLRGTWAINTRQPSVTDLNFSGRQLGSLAAEGGRPLFVLNGIDPQTGLLTIGESRRSSEYARVLERRSDLRSESRALTATLNFNPAFWFTSSGIHAPFTLSYSVVDTRAQTNGFLGTTRGDPRVVTMASQPTSRHNILLSTLVQIPAWVRVSAGLQVRSGVPYTPRVNRDINGDGWANDRAYVFEASDTAVGRRIGDVFRSSPARVRSCLAAQTGRIAAASSCVGPWSAGLNVDIGLDPDRLGLQNRGSIQFRLTNVLAGFDQLLHGTRDTRGWGQTGAPDPVLLNVEGYDAVRRGFRYGVNPQFGSISASRTALQAPFRITVDVRLDVGPNREREAIAQRFAVRVQPGDARLDSAQIMRRLIPRPSGVFDPLLDMRESLRLTGPQVDSLVAMNRRHRVTTDSAYGRLAGFFAADGIDYRSSAVLERWREAMAVVGWSEWAVITAMQDLLTLEQRTAIAAPFAVPSRLQQRLDRNEMERELRRWRAVPF